MRIFRLRATRKIPARNGADGRHRSPYAGCDDARQHRRHRRCGRCVRTDQGTGVPRQDFFRGKSKMFKAARVPHTRIVTVTYGTRELDDAPLKLAGEPGFAVKREAHWSDVTSAAKFKQTARTVPILRKYSALRHRTLQKWMFLDTLKSGESSVPRRERRRTLSPGDRSGLYPMRPLRTRIPGGHTCQKLHGYRRRLPLLLLPHPFLPGREQTGF